MLQAVQATRYVVPLREGGSLPAIVEASDDGMYVVKFTGAGQGPRVLAAEIIAAGVADALGIPVPDRRLIDFPAAVAKYEADEEAQDLLNASPGLNLGSDYLPGAAAYEATTDIEPDLASRIMWLDALIMNIDRTWHNPNLLVWHSRVWCIDHGASLYFHHGWERSVDPAHFASSGFRFDDHVLAEVGEVTERVHATCAPLVSDDVLHAAVAEVPGQWLLPNADSDEPRGVRTAYVEYLARRRDAAPWLMGQ